MAVNQQSIKQKLTATERNQSQPITGGAEAGVQKTVLVSLISKDLNVKLLEKG
jgi:hypothetical protein